MSTASGTIDADGEVIGPVQNGRLGVSWQITISGTITVTPQYSLDGATWLTAATAVTSTPTTLGTSNVPGAAYRLLASSVSGGSAVCHLIAAV
jgi:hypothetical protein